LELTPEETERGFGEALNTFGEKRRRNEKVLWLSLES
jgi:hypothetical protein